MSLAVRSGIAEPDHVFGTSAVRFDAQSVSVYVSQMAPAKPSPAPFTYEDYAAMPSDGRRIELIDGEFEMNAAPSSRHQTVSRRLQFELMKGLEETELALVFNAPIDLILSDQHVLQPDLLILRRAREHLVTERGVEGAPDVVVEILSPSTRALDQRVKKGVYARFGVPEYWLVDPALNNIEQWRLTGADFQCERLFEPGSRLTSPSFPQLSVDLQRVFRA